MACREGLKDVIKIDVIAPDRCNNALSAICDKAGSLSEIGKRGGEELDFFLGRGT